MLMVARECQILFVCLFACIFLTFALIYLLFSFQYSINQFSFILNVYHSFLAHLYFLQQKPN